MEKDRQVSYEDAKQLADGFEMPFIEASARLNKNVEELFSLAIKNYLTVSSVQRPSNHSTNNLTNVAQRNKSANLNKVVIGAKKDENKEEGCCGK